MKLTEKQKQVDMQIWAIEELGKRYLFNSSPICYEQNGIFYYFNPRLPIGKEEQKELVIECCVTIGKESASHGCKKAARILLGWLIGKEKANDLIGDIAIIDNRNDPLVRRWRNAVIKRDGKCTDCDSNEDLHAHHISHWADDPVNRININNGITLCKECHAKQHPEISFLILS